MNLLFLLLMVKNLERTSSETCRNILKFESYEGLQTLEAIYNYITSLGCFLCTEPKCDFEDKYCEKWSDMPEIPVYNNIFEFGFAGNHFPVETRVNITLNKSCYLLVKVFAQFSRGAVVVRVFECLFSEPNCLSQIYQNTLEILFEHKNCFYFGLIFHESNKIHFAESLNCKIYASRYFKDSASFPHKRNICHFKKGSDFIFYKLELLQNERRKYDGIPVIVPCSPGGFIVDPRTGRFVVGEPCLNSFDGQEPNTGLYFIIDKVYERNESLFFPFEQFAFSMDFNPLYLTKDGKVYNTTQMRSKRRRNELLGTETIPKIRSGCRFYPFKKGSSGDIDLIGVTPEPKGEKLTDDVTVIIAGKTYYSCESILSPENFKGTNPINKFVPHTACFVCAKPSPNCDYVKDPRCPKLDILEFIPLYHNYLEFGLLAMHLPMISVATIKLNKYCYLKAEIRSKKSKSQNVTFSLSECFFSDHHCIQVNSTKEVIILPDNYHCAYVALAFFNDSRIYYAVNFECKVFASSKFNINQFLNIKHEACQYEKVENDLTANFTFFQDENRTYNGIPFILPCSPGGFSVEPKTGRFVSNDTCWKLFWTSEPDTGIDFIINKIFGGKEDLLFPIETEKNKSFPRPIYMKFNDRALSRKEMAPSLVPIKNHKNKIRKSCTFVPGNKTDDDENGTRNKKATNTSESASSKGSNSSVSDKSRRSAESSTPNYTILLLMLIIFIT